MGDSVLASLPLASVIVDTNRQQGGKTGYKSQQTEQPENENRQSNLWEPLPGDHGAHGSFDERAQDYSAQLWATQNQDWFFLALGAGVACVAVGAYLGYQAQPKQSAAREDKEDKITEKEINSEVVDHINQSSKKDQFQMLMGLARFGWKTLTAQPKA